MRRVFVNRFRSYLFSLPSCTILSRLIHPLVVIRSAVAFSNFSLPFGGCSPVAKRSFNSDARSSIDFLFCFFGTTLSCPPQPSRARTSCSSCLPTRSCH